MRDYFKPYQAQGSVYFGSAGMYFGRSISTFTSWDLTVCFWMMHRQATSSYAINGFLDAGSAKVFGLYTNSSDQFFLRVYTSPGVSYTDTTFTNLTLIPTKWYHVCFQIDTSINKANLYVDGIYIGNADCDPSTYGWDSPSSMNLGNMSGETSTSESVAHYKIWNKVLRQEEIIREAWKYGVYDEDGIFAYFPLNCGGNSSSSTQLLRLDHSKNRNHFSNGSCYFRPYLCPIDQYYHNNYNFKAGAGGIYYDDSVLNALGYLNAIGGLSLDGSNTLSANVQLTETENIDANNSIQISSSGQAIGSGILDAYGNIVLQNSGAISLSSLLDAYSVITLQSNGIVNIIGAGDMSVDITLSNVGLINVNGNLATDVSIILNLNGTLLTAGGSVIYDAINLLNNSVVANNVLKELNELFNLNITTNLVSNAYGDLFHEIILNSNISLLSDSQLIIIAESILSGDIQLENSGNIVLNALIDLYLDVLQNTVSDTGVGYRNYLSVVGYIAKYINKEGFISAEIMKEGKISLRIKKEVDL